ncbi:Protein SERAC1 [Beauveria bassiana D1-5]|uniref:Protein SERAC1 n=1 Tax=Beauveria bassiana D1-5 TaxID=1245745 RepID=A0A0A2V700_BEABA|nr:Protein SERAC1 [Beauveria bassiana D1-5]
MAVEWRWMIGWWGGLAIVTLLLARSLHRVIGKICRPRNENRSGTLQILSGKDDAKFEIIAVPGLGAHPYHTWEAQKTEGPNAAECQTAQSPKVHLLKDLLAHEFPDARIWNFAHESTWLIDAPVKTTEEIGKCLLKEIKDKRPFPSLPIIFIGHSLGGIIIKQALCTGDSQDIVDNTAGIIFLGAPHQGSSVSIAGAALAALTGFLGSDTTLLLSLKNHGAQLSNLTDTFDSSIAPNERRERKIPIISFYETKKTYLLGLSLGVVVSRDSAKVHADARESHSIETDHSGLNKCGGPTDPLFTALTAAIRRLKTPSLLEQADTWIRDKHYTADRLRIQRLSGESLSMDQCYINLAIVEQSGQDAGNSKKGDTAPSPFSILSRQKVEAPDKTMQVELAALFNERHGSDGEPILPRRILIRGRTWDKWNGLFDRVLWVPLRNLKLQERRNAPTYILEDLFCHEFLLPNNEPNLARALVRTSETKSSKTLFLLDGLDEVSQDLTGDGSMPRFLHELLRKPNVIITSRPSAKPVRQNLHLELETIGFGPDQVDEYIEKAFTNPKTAKIDQTKVDKVQSFLQKHWLVKGLIRIPIQLDALCYTWEEFDPKAVPSTMTRMYNTIVQKLWKKDIVRLEKIKEGFAEVAHIAEIENKATAEMALVECLAFSGLYHDIIDFTPEHRNGVVKLCPLQDLPLDETLSRLSFLRTSDPDSNLKDRNYHFIHLTFQEYFAARYFVRQWTNQEGQLWTLTFGSKDANIKTNRPIEFLQKHKYTARYDIFWRFVTGLLDGSEQAPELIYAIEKEPLDLLGPTHQRLIMHCLSEISGSLPRREALEKRLAQWLLFECRFNQSARLASEVEFPEGALRTALLCQASANQATILRSLAERIMVPPSIFGQVAGRLDDEDEDVRRAAVWALGGRSALPDEVLAAVAGRLGDKDSDVRRAAVEALGGRSTLPNELLAAMAGRLEDDDENVRSTAGWVLGGRLALPDEVLSAVAGRLDDERWYVRRAAVEALGRRSALPDEVLAAVVGLLDDDNSAVRRAVVETLGGRSADKVLAAVAARHNDEDSLVRRAVIQAIGGRSALPDKVLAAVVGRLDDECWYVRSAAVETLGRNSTLPHKILAAVVERLDDIDEDVRSITVWVLGRRSTLPDEILATVAGRLNDEDWDVRRAAVDALGGRSALPDEMLAAVAGRLDDKDSDVRRAAVEALGGRSALPDKMLAAVAGRLDDKDLDVRWAAIKALGERSSLPDEVLAAVAGRLDDENSTVRRAAVKVLGGMSALPDAILAAMAGRLDDEDSNVRSAAVDILTSTNDKLYHIGPVITSLYKALLERSFREQTSWYIEQCNVCVNMPDSIRELNIDLQQNDVKEWLNGAQPADCPTNLDGVGVGEKVVYDSDILGGRKMKLRGDFQTARLRYSISKESKRGGNAVDEDVNLKPLRSVARP